ncbi:MAG: carbon-nitrogen hydrolase family protein [Candidatus Izemoplasmatales bacterium]
MKICVIQNKVYESVEENIKNLVALEKKLLETSYDFIVFPEMFTTPYQLKYFKNTSSRDNREVLAYLKALAIRYNTYVVGGSIPEISENKIYNSSFVFDRSGNLMTKYRKIHLFSVTYPNGQSFSENDVLSSGREIITFNTEFGRMGLMICFDIRFPRLAYLLQQQGVKVIFVPAAFNTYTGPMHWYTTFKARAIDNQLFLVGASPARDSFGSYEPYGHSLIVNPLGQVIKDLDEKQGIIDTEINLDDIEKARQSIPIVKNQVDI